jgi:hypothetical protein
MMLMKPDKVLKEFELWMDEVIDKNEDGGGFNFSGVIRYAKFKLQEIKEKS